MDGLDRDGDHYRRRVERFMLPDGSPTAMTVLENHARACAPTLFRRLGLPDHRAVFGELPVVRIIAAVLAMLSAQRSPLCLRPASVSYASSHA